MADLYARLARLGYTKPYVQRVFLPDWWDDSLASNPTTLAQAELIVARELGIDIEHLSDPRAVSSALKGVHFKTRGKVGHDMEPTVRLARRLAKIAALTCRTPYRPDVVLSPRLVRAAILNAQTARVDLGGLLDFCWRSGIPVIHLRHVPTGAKKPDGLVCLAEGRPVIVIASRKAQPAWHLFILAHELGHLMAGHLRDDGMYLDEKVELSSDDGQEIEANRKAVELLAGDEDFSFNPLGTFTAETLAAKARQLGTRELIDPGFVALTFSHSRPKYYPLAVKALNEMFPGEEAAACYPPQYEDLALEEMPEHTRHVFESLTR